MIETLDAFLFAYEIACCLALALYSGGILTQDHLRLCFGFYLYLLTKSDYLFDRADFAAGLVGSLKEALGL